MEFSCANGIANNLAIDNFKLEAKTLLDDLQARYTEKERLIVKTFNKLFDNLPDSIRNSPINEFYDAYLNLIKTEDVYQKIQPTASFQS